MSVLALAIQRHCTQCDVVFNFVVVVFGIHRRWNCDALFAVGPAPTVVDLSRPNNRTVNACLDTKHLPHRPRHSTYVSRLAFFSSPLSLSFYPRGVDVEFAPKWIYRCYRGIGRFLPEGLRRVPEWGYQRLRQYRNRNSGYARVYAYISYMCNQPLRWFYLRDTRDDFENDIKFIS